MTRARKLEIQGVARQALIDHGAMKLPVRPKVFAEEKLGITVTDFDPPEPSFSGVLIQSGNDFLIGFSTAIKNEGFQNFTVAHELGHFFIDGHAEELLREGQHYSRSGFISEDPREREADLFATEFLMPWKLIEPIVHGNKRGFKAIKEVADQCESSIVASAIRFAEVSKESVAVIVSYQGAVEFMVGSEAFKGLPGIDWLSRGDRLPQRSPTYSFVKNLEWVRECGVEEAGSTLSTWFSSAPNLEIEEDIVGLGGYGRLMTVLITESNEEEDDEGSEDDDWIDRWKDGIFRDRRR